MTDKPMIVIGLMRRVYDGLRVGRHDHRGQDIIKKGGEGSGYKEPHEGLPGVWGGSRPRGGGQTKYPLGKRNLILLAKLATRYETFDDFELDYQRNNYHGQYWHLTKDKDFEIDPTQAPTEMSSLGTPNTQPGLMVTTDVANWQATLGPTRAYAALIDLSDLEPNVDYRHTTRGFGHEIFVSKPEKAKVVAVLPIATARRRNDRYYEETVPQSRQELRDVWEWAHANLVTRGGKGSGYHAPHKGLPDVHGGSAPRGGNERPSVRPRISPKEIHQEREQFFGIWDKQINKAKQFRDWLMGRIPGIEKITVGPKAVLDFQDESGNVAHVQVGEGWGTIEIPWMEVDRKGEGLGTKIVEGLADYALLRAKDLYFYAIANPKFFHRFEGWDSTNEPFSKMVPVLYRMSEEENRAIQEAVTTSGIMRRVVIRGSEKSGYHKPHKGLAGVHGGSAPRDNGKKKWPEDKLSKVMAVIDKEWNPTEEISVFTMDYNFWILPDGRILDVNEHSELGDSIYENLADEFTSEDHKKWETVEERELKSQGFVRANFHSRGAAGRAIIMLEIEQGTLSSKVKQTITDMYWVAYGINNERPNVLVEWWEDNKWYSYSTSSLAEKPMTIEQINRKLGFRIDRSMIERGGEGSGYHDPHKGLKGTWGGSTPRESSPDYEGKEEREPLTEGDKERIQRAIAFVKVDERWEKWWLDAATKIEPESKEGKDYVYVSYNRPLGSWVRLEGDIAYVDRVLWSKEPLSMEEISKYELAPILGDSVGALMKEYYEELYGERNTYVFYKVEKELGEYRGAVIHPTVSAEYSEKYPWRLTTWDFDGFSGHDLYTSLEEALGTAARIYGFVTPLRPETFERVVTKERFMKGVEENMRRWREMEQRGLYENRPADLRYLKTVLDLIRRGGQGSGYHGPDHKGLPEVWGGSRPRGEAEAPPEFDASKWNPWEHNKIISKHNLEGEKLWLGDTMRRWATAMEFPPTDITFVCDEVDEYLDMVYNSEAGKMVMAQKYGHLSEEEYWEEVNKEKQSSRDKLVKCNGAFMGVKFANAIFINTDNIIQTVFMKGGPPIFGPHEGDPLYTQIAREIVYHELGHWADDLLGLQAEFLYFDELPDDYDPPVYDLSLKDEEYRADLICAYVNSPESPHLNHRMGGQWTPTGKSLEHLEEYLDVVRIRARKAGFLERTKEELANYEVVLIPDGAGGYEARMVDTSKFEMVEKGGKGSGYHAPHEGLPEVWGGSKPRKEEEDKEPEEEEFDWFKWQDENIEQIPKKMGRNVPEGMRYEPGRWLGLHSEGMGDVFRELAKWEFWKTAMADWSYIEEKLRRLEKDMNIQPDRDYIFKGKLSPDDEERRQELIRLWENPPEDMPAVLSVARDLNVLLLERIPHAVEMAIDEIRWWQKHGKELIKRGGEGSGYHGPDHKGLSGVHGGSRPRDERAPGADSDFHESVHDWPETKPWKHSRAEFEAGEVPFIKYDPKGRWPAAHRTDHVLVRPSYFELNDDEKIMVLYHEIGHSVARELFKPDIQDKIFEAIEYFREPFREEKKEKVSVRSRYHNFIGTNVGDNKRPEEFIADIYMDLIFGGESGWEPGGNYQRPYQLVREMAAKLGLPTEPLFKWEKEGDEYKLVERGGEGSGYKAPHCGLPDEWGGSAPREECAPEEGKRIVKVLRVQDTREYGEDAEGRYKAIGGTGVPHECDRCGKWHEVYAYVELANGEISIVGTTCAKSEFAEKLRKEMATKERASKRLKELESEFQAKRAAWLKWHEEYAKVKDLPLPPIEFEEKEGKYGYVNYIAHMEDATVYYSSQGWNEERKQTLIESWRGRRMSQRGYTSWVPHYDVTKYEKEIAKARERAGQNEPIVERGGEGSGYSDPHCGLPEEWGGSRPREECGGAMSTEGEGTAAKPSRQQYLEAYKKFETQGLGAKYTTEEVEAAKEYFLDPSKITDEVKGTLEGRIASTIEDFYQRYLEDPEGKGHRNERKYLETQLLRGEGGRFPDPTSYEAVTYDHRRQWTDDGLQKAVADHLQNGVIPWETSEDDFVGAHPWHDIDASDKSVTDTVEMEKAIAEYRGRAEYWRTQMGMAVARGDLTPQQAREFGYTGGGDVRTDSWQELPDTLYHVTTALGPVLEGGLKSRVELGQANGTGLGGGSDDTISFTEDENIANTIYHSLIEARQVARGEITVPQMIEMSQSGEGAKREWFSVVVKYWDKTWQEGDPLPVGIQNIIDGVDTRRELMGSTQEQMDEKHPGEGWRPVENPQTFQPVEIQGQLLAREWIRDLTPHEQQNRNFDFYKTWSTFRQHAGGPDDPCFFSSNPRALAEIDPSQIGIVRASGTGLGWQLHALGEWRTFTGAAVNIAGTVQPGERPMRPITPNFWEEKSLQDRFMKPPNINGKVIAANGPAIDDPEDMAREMLRNPELILEDAEIRVNNGSLQGYWQNNKGYARNIKDNSRLLLKKFGHILLAEHAVVDIYPGRMNYEWALQVADHKGEPMRYPSFGNWEAWFVLREAQELNEMVDNVVESIERALVRLA